MEAITYKRHPEYTHLFCGENGTIFSLKSSIFLKPIKTKKGYFTVNTNRKFRPIHRLVMECFVGKSNLQVDHIDRNKANNNLSNLEYVTNKENNKRSNPFRTWDKVTGELSSRSVLTEESVLLIRKLNPSGNRDRSELGKLLGVSLSTINDVLKRKTWKHL